ncbi:MAG: permease [Gammaproteobacteria bacterium]|nr:permease [Gammaproteobacteria bacterium]
MTELFVRGFHDWRERGFTLKSIWTLIALILLALYSIDAANFHRVLSIAINAFGGTLLFIAIAVACIAYLKACGAEAVVAKAFAGNETRMILFAALFGGLAPFCSCEVIPFIAGLLAVGAPLSAVMAFWLSSPLIDPPTVVITAGALGWDFAIGKTIAAVGLGLMGGFVIALLLRTGVFSDPLRQRSCGGCGCGPSPFAGRPVWRFWHEGARREVFKSELGSNFLFLVKWLALAYLLEGLLITYVPAQVIAGVVGGEGLGAIAIGALAGAPAYLNGYAAPALVAGLMEQGMSAGAAMAFMISGSVSCIPAMAAVWSLVKCEIFVAYLLLGVSGAILAGALFGAIQAID